MTKRELREMHRLAEAIQNHSVTGTIYDGSKRTEVNSLAEIRRKLDSQDYKDGWKACSDLVMAYVNHVLYLHNVDHGRRIRHVESKSKAGK